MVLLVLAAVCTLAVLVPPLGLAIRHYAFAEALQYVVIAVAGPALFVLGAPWQLWSSRNPSGTSLADRVARSRSGGPGGLAPFGYLAAFMVAAIIWRLPPVVDALARNPVLVVAELVTLFPAGCGVRLELVASPPLLPRIGRPLRAVFAAASMWTIWVLAYIMAFSDASGYSVYAHHAGMALSTAADNQVAAGIMWAIPAFCGVPVIFNNMLHWLGDSSDPDAEMRAISVASSNSNVTAPAPPRGWRTRSRP